MASDDAWTEVPHLYEAVMAVVDRGYLPGRPLRNRIACFWRLVESMLTTLLLSVDAPSNTAA